MRDLGAWPGWGAYIQGLGLNAEYIHGWKAEYIHGWKAEYIHGWKAEYIHGGLELILQDLIESARAQRAWLSTG